MPETILTLNSIGKSIFLVLLNTSLQVTLLILLAWSAIWIFRLRSAATRYYLWFLAVFGILTLPLFGALLPGIDISILGNDEVIMEPMYMDISGVYEDIVNQADMKANAATVSEESSSKTVGEADLDMKPWGEPGVNEPGFRELLNLTNTISLIWFMAASVMLCRLIRSYIWLAHFKRRAQKVEEGPILEAISGLRERMGITRRIQVFISSKIHSPTSFGLFSTTIILPESMVNSRSDPPGRLYRELEMVLSHEMAHAKRHDYLVNLFQRILQSVFFFHPLFRMASRRLTREREHICDDWVIQATGRRDDYAECLIGLVEKAVYRPKAVSMAMMGHPHNISRRVDMIIDNRRGVITAISRKAGAAILIIGCILLPMLAATRIVYTAESRAPLALAPAEVKITAGDGEKEDGFGYSVDIHGGYAIVGAAGDDDKGESSGSAYIFKREGTSWKQQEKLIPKDGTKEDYFGYSVAISDNYAIVGAPGDDDRGTDTGSVYFFKREGNSWSEEVKFTPHGQPITWCEFGYSVDISGDYVIVGSFDEDWASGAAYIFHYDGNSWDEEDKFTAKDNAAQDKFGYAVSIDGDYAIVGAEGDKDKGDWTGSAYIFKREDTSWIEQAKLTASDAAAKDQFGYSVHISGDYAIVGAGWDDDKGESSGSAYIFKREGTSWMEQAKITASDGETWHCFGVAVYISGDYAIVAAPYDDDKGHASGSIYVFLRSGTSWEEVSKYTASDGAPGGVVRHVHFHLR